MMKLKDNNYIDSIGLRTLFEDDRHFQQEM